MLCKNCNTERELSDFFGKEICYKCEYKRKKKEIRKFIKCKVCNGVLPPGRWTYCSRECARIGKNRNKHWTTKLKGGILNQRISPYRIEDDEDFLY